MTNDFCCEFGQFIQMLPSKINSVADSKHFYVTTEYCKYCDQQLFCTFEMGLKQMVGKI